MGFQKLINKLLPALNHESTHSGAGPDKHSTKSTLRSSRSFSKTSLLGSLPPLPSYEEATGLTTTPEIPTSQLSSLGQLGDALFDRVSDSDGNHIFLSRQGKAVLYVYYVLLQYALDFAASYHRQLPEQLPQYQAEGPAAASQALINAVGNYAFLLALLHASKRYKIAGKRLLFLVNPDVVAVRYYVKEEMVKDVLRVPHNNLKGYKMSKGEVRKVLDRASSGILDHADHVFDTKACDLIQDSIDIGEIDGSNVQECWSLFKTVLIEKTRTGDLLPPPRFNRYQSPAQPAMMGGLWSGTNW